MLTLRVENEKIEQIFLNEFHSNSDKFFDFIQESYEKLKKSQEIKEKNSLVNLQEVSMASTWEDEDNKVWDEL